MAKATEKPGYRYVGGPEDDKPLPVITIGKKEVHPGDVLPASKELEGDPRFVVCLDTSGS